VSDRRTAEVRLARMAHTDALTGLPNRARLIERLGAALRRDGGEPISVLFIDLDAFKRVNDTLGHPAGDELLRHTSDRLTSALRPQDELFRLGGDEFVALCPNTDLDAAVAVGERLRNALTDPFRLRDALTRASASVGIRVARTGNDETPDQVLRDADTAMYAAKDQGRNRVVAFSPELRADLLRRVELGEALHEALETDRLRLVYQPIVDLLDGRVLGVEALMRWDHPTEGAVSPLEIVAIARETAQVERLDSWVLDRAADQVVAWRSADVALPFVAVNVCFGSPEQLRLAELVESICRSGRLGDTRLVLELTEGSLLEHRAEEELIAVREQGVYLAVDDFGTGHSSLSRLQQLPIDMLKVDRSFVDGLGTETHDSAIVTSVLELAATMGLHVIAEGVESERQAAMLLGLGCRAVQGYVFNKPKPPDALAPALRTGYRRITNTLARLHRPEMARDRLRAAAHLPRPDQLRGKRRLIDEMQHQLGIEVPR